MTQEKSIKILFVEDLPTDVTLAEREMDKNGIAYASRRVDTKEGLLEALVSFSPDIVVSDYSMPLFDGLSALHLVKKFDPDIPFLVLTGSMNEEVAVECMKAGACDYVIKEHLSRFAYAIQVAMERTRLERTKKIQEENLRQSEERYRSIFADSNAIMLIIDPKESLIIDANRSAVDFYGWPRDELIGKKMTDINTAPSGVLREQMHRAVAKEKSHFVFKHRLADGTVRDIEAHSGPVIIDDEKYLFSVIHDISDRLAVERERDLLAQRLSHYLEMSPAITYSLSLKEGAAQIDWVSENIQSILGFATKEALEADWWFEHVFRADRASAMQGIPSVIKKENHSHDYRFVKKNRAVIWLRDAMRLIKTDEGNTEIIGTLTDITANKLVEEEMRLKGAALEALDAAVVITDRGGVIEWTNQAFGSLTGYTAHEAWGKNPRDLVKSDKQDPEAYRQLWDTILAGKSWRGEIINKKKSGQLYNEEMTITPVMDPDTKIGHFIAIKTDITERVISNERLRTSLAEKEVLLREIHHRVKNNMQIVSSLLRLSSENTRDLPMQSLITELNRRIEAMSIVHEQFYAAEDVSRIDFTMSLLQITNTLLEECRIAPETIDVVMRTKALMLNLNSAIPAGLIVSELISNALKGMAPSGGRKHALSVSVQYPEPGRASIEIKDNGPGLPPGFDPKTARTLGMRLIEILSEQLRGTISFDSSDGTTATLTFPLVTK